MPKPRSPNRDKAYEIYKEHNGKIELNAIAAKLGIGDGTVRGWKNKDKWEERNFGTPPKKSMERSKRNTERSEPKKRGGQAGNTNAKGKGEGKIGNQNAIKHGLFAKYSSLKALTTATIDMLVIAFNINPDLLSSYNKRLYKQIFI
ncbi:hypothetical protein HCB37_01255 [Listeria booriae]|uniref:phage terminase small subunit n=1 Tax=Listeria booriae TaxID=1552123 RepID=UPI00162A079C|nr:phage terminase small subunit [Listeria booriae]MBC2263133.1 hypothetical protein [Listeria booriae]